MLKKKNKIFIMVLVIISFMTLVYSSYSNNLGINNISATIKLSKDIRITGISINKVENDGTSSYEEYNVHNISTGPNLPNSTSKVIYNVEITNLGNVEMGIYNITGLPDNLEYEISNLELKEKICDNDKCTLGIRKEIQITIKYKENGFNESNTNYNILLNFDFRPIYKITYEGVSGNYPKEIIEGDPLKINFGSSKKSSVEITENNILFNDYEYENGDLKVPSVKGNLHIKYINNSKVELRLKKETIIRDLVLTENYTENTWKDIILNNIESYDIYGNRLSDVKIEYELYDYDNPNIVNISKEHEAIYIIKYMVNSNEYSYAEINGRLVVRRPIKIDFTSNEAYKLITYDKTDNYYPKNNSVLLSENMTATHLDNNDGFRLSSTIKDPKMTIAFRETNYVNTSIYRYVIAKYKNRSFTQINSDLMGIYMSKNPKPGEVEYVGARNLDTTDNEEVTMILDLWENENILNGEAADGIRFDYAELPNVTLDLLSIEFVMPRDLSNYMLYRMDNFTEENKSTFIRKNISSSTTDNGNLTLITNEDPQLNINLENVSNIEEFENLYIKYKSNNITDSSTMELFIIEDANYSLRYDSSRYVLQSNKWYVTEFKRQDKENYTTSKLLERNGGTFPRIWRLDPLPGAGNITIDYIAIPKKGIRIASGYIQK